MVYYRKKGHVEKMDDFVLNYENFCNAIHYKLSKDEWLSVVSELEDHVQEIALELRGDNDNS